MTETDYIFVPEFGYEVTKRIVVSQTPEYIASYNLSRLGDGQVVAFAHLDVFDFVPSVFRQMLGDWKTFRPTMPADLFCMAEEDTRVHAHFVRKLGFLHVGDIPCTDGNTRRLYMHRL